MLAQLIGSYLRRLEFENTYLAQRIAITLFGEGESKSKSGQPAPQGKPLGRAKNGDKMVSATEMINMTGGFH